MSNTPTSATLIDGKALAKSLLERTQKRVEALKKSTGITPCLVTVLVGADPASVTYTNMKRKRCESIGMKSIKVELPENTSEKQLIEKITELGNDKNIHGILLQHPVPSHINERSAFEAIPPEKDVDGVTIRSFGAASFSLPGFGSCTPAGIMHILKAYKVDIEGKHAVVVGRSPILGKPVAMMLLGENATVTICHSRTKNLEQIVNQGDIVVAAVGKPEFVKGDWIKKGAVVIDAGYNPGNVGDVEFQIATQKTSLITPVPGGVGPMTIAILIEQTMSSAEKSADV